MTSGGPVVGYVRVSTEEQGDFGAGLEAQRQAITAECRARGWHFLAIHEDVASGKAFTNRPGLDAALQAAPRGSWYARWVSTKPSMALTTREWPAISATWERC
jgi:DNA invertase Pin-like site-specific DNA recombinase